MIDTAGRLHVDAEMMDEVQQLEAAINPHERLFVVDSMAGQDAVNAAKAFNEALSLTGVILTKADGDARGGAALSVRQVTGKPILFVGTGEKSEALELFQPERIASRILGMGDVLSLVEQVQEQVDQEKAEKLAKKISKGKSFDLSDLRDQLSQLQKMGGMSALLDKLPAQLQANAAAAAAAVNPKVLKRQMGIIDSMTPRERRRPEIIDGSRKRRIAAGAGVQLPGGQPPAEAVRPDAKDHEKGRQGRDAQEPDAGHGRAAAARDGPPALAEALGFGRRPVVFGCSEAIEFITISGSALQGRRQDGDDPIDSTGRQEDAVLSRRGDR